MILASLFRRLARARRARRLLAQAQARLEEGKVQEALPLLQQAVAANESDPASRLTLGEAQLVAGAARAAAEQLQQCLALLDRGDTRRVRALLLLADALRDAGEPVRAEEAYAEVLASEPANARALLESAMQRFNASDIPAARELMDRHIAVRRESAAARLRRAALLPAIVFSIAEIDEVVARFERDLETAEDGRLESIADPAAEVGLLPFFLAYYGRECLGPMQRYYRTCSRFYRPPGAPAQRRPGDRIRVGFVSTFFYAHSIGRTTFGLIADLPREHFEVIVFSIAPHDDPWSQAIARHCDQYVVLPTRLEAVREAIAAAAVDVLFFADIGMHPLTHFLAYARLAPLQLTTWGHPVTTGIATMDYFVSHEALEGADAQAHYSEKLLRLPAFLMPRYQKSELARPRSRREQGLPEDRHLYVCPQTLFKLHPDFDRALGQILERDPRGEVILLEGHPRWAELLRQRFRGTVASADERIRFVPQRKHHEFLHLLAAADVVLDPFHFGGNNSSCEALGLAVPVVTLPAERVAGRFTQALYQEMSLAECVAVSPEDYVRLAVELGTEPEQREAVSREIRARNDCLFQRTDSARALGEALLQIVR